jgi:hypothetical protein
LYDMNMWSTCDLKAPRACSLPTMGKVKHSFFGLSQPKSKYFTPPWGPEIFACGNLAAFRLATIYLPQCLLLKWVVVKYSGVPFTSRRCESHIPDKKSETCPPEIVRKESISRVLWAHVSKSGGIWRENMFSCK